MKFRSLAPAKINLHLSILDRREDGFHNLSGLFQAVTLYDELTVETCDSGCCSVFCREINLPEDNTLTRAYGFFKELTGFSRGINVTLKKVIPSGAGLGGGSSDGAALLRILNTISGENVPFRNLKAVAEKTGSDVPFSLMGGTGVVSGRGDILEPLTIPGMERKLYFLLIWPEVFSSTPEAYRLFDLEKDPVLKDYGIGEFRDFFCGEPKTWPFINSFEPLIAARFPRIRKALDALKTVGAEFVSMSGSGSSVYGVFCDEVSCNRAFKSLAENWRFCYAIESLGANPPVEIF